MNKIKQLRSTTEEKERPFFPNFTFFFTISPFFTWLEELGVELLGAGPRLPGVLPGADRRVVRLLRLAPGCGRPEQAVLVVRERLELRRALKILDRMVTLGRLQ